MTALIRCTPSDNTTKNASGPPSTGRTLITDPTTTEAPSGHGDGAPAPSITGTTNGGVSDNTSRNARLIGNTGGADESIPTANVTALSCKSIGVRLPLKITNVWPPYPAKIADPSPNAAIPSPRTGAAPITVTTVLPAGDVVSHTDHLDSDPTPGLGIRSGAPGIPTNGPRGNSANSEAFTKAGIFGLSTINRADGKFNTGCKTSLILTYNAPVSLSATISESRN